jgi:hypothetical protein
MKPSVMTTKSARQIVRGAIVAVRADWSCSSRIPHFAIDPTQPGSDAARASSRLTQSLTVTRGSSQRGCQPPVTSLPSRAVPAGQCVRVAREMARLWQAVPPVSLAGQEPRSCSAHPVPAATALGSSARSWQSQTSRTTSARSFGRDSVRVHRCKQRRGLCRQPTAREHACRAGPGTSCSRPTPSYT